MVKLNLHDDACFALAPIFSYFQYKKKIKKHTRRNVFNLVVVTLSKP
jgi:hypothetical protein